MFSDNNVLIEKYIKLACSGIAGSIIRDNEIIIKCNICGDGKKHSNKRGHFKYCSKSNKPFWYYKCFNGDCIAYNKSFPAQWWLQNYHPTLYRSYQSEALRTSNDSEIEVIKQSNSLLSTTKTKKTLEDKKTFKHFYPISSDHDLCNLAISFCEKRRIPKSIYSKFYVCTKDLYRNRLIIPFYDINKKIVYFQGRSLDGSEPKYLNKVDSEKCIYNLDFVDKNKPICVLEGAIDSMFIENSIALSGLSISKNIESYLNKLQVYYIFDDDTAGNKLTITYLELGKFVFLWSKFKKDNNLNSIDGKLDINDSYIKMNRTELFKFEELKPYFTNNWFDKIYV